MKIPKKLTKKVNDSLDNTKVVLSESIIELAKMIGADNEDDIYFERNIILHEESKAQRNGVLTINNMIVNKINVSPTHNLFMVGFENEYSRCSFHLSLESLITIYREMLKVVKEY